MKKINKLFDLAGFDGCKHIIISSVLAAVLSLIVPNIVAAVITFGIGWAKGSNGVLKNHFPKGLRWNSSVGRV